MTAIEELPFPAKVQPRCAPRGCCGYVKEDMDLSERIYVCDNPDCGFVIDRDLNAALNLAALALLYLSGKPGPHREFLGKGDTLVESGTLADLS